MEQIKKEAWEKFCSGVFVDPESEWTPKDYFSSGFDSAWSYRDEEFAKLKEFKRIMVPIVNTYMEEIEELKNQLHPAKNVMSHDAYQVRIDDLEGQLKEAVEIINPIADLKMLDEANDIQISAKQFLEKMESGE